MKGLNENTYIYVCIEKALPGIWCPEKHSVSSFYSCWNFTPVAYKIILFFIHSLPGYNMYLPKIFKDNQKQAKESQQRIKVGKSQCG